ncbi:pyridoxine 5'-phosphate synthase [Psychrobacter sp.]|uniref:pyridoxine 5'-phosphate synthase n=1 Tax=Psychrobacter sp. TaxID=56811 RepID=UPI003568C567
MSVNIDHVATLRQARGVSYPSSLVREGGAAAIELHTGAYAEASLVADMDMQNA